MRSASGKVERWVGTWTDIDDLERAQEDSSRKAVLLANVRDAVVVTDLEGIVTYWNDGATRLFGWNAEEMIGRALVARYPPEARANVQERMRDIARGRDFVGEWLDWRKDGTRVWIDARVRRIADASGRPFGIMGISQNISGRKEAEEGMRLRDRALQTINQGILITDAQSRDHPIVYASPSFEQLTGFASGDIIGKNPRFLQGPSTNLGSVDQVRDALASGKGCTVWLVNYRKNGMPFWNELSISPLRDDRGRLTHFVGVQADVTHRRQLEEQLRQAQKMEAIGLLAGGVAHDFNNLLTIITGYSDLLLQSLPDDDPTRELLEEIRKAGRRSASVTRQLLAFSRKQVLAPRILNLNEVVHDTEKMLQRLIGEDVRLDTVLDGSLDNVRADPGQIEQVLLNLAVNARDAMPQGGSLRIETKNVVLDEAFADVRPGVKAGPYVMLTMSDTGIGMAEEVQRHVFEPFFTTKGPTKGTGLGLSVVHGIVQQSDGHIEVASEIGVGTTFTIYLARTAEIPRAESPAGTTASALSGTETILLVEDEEAVRALSRHVLRMCGYTVLEAGDVDEAQRICTESREKIHLLVTDVVMPGMGGRALAERLLEQRPDMEVLYVSGYTDDAVVRHGILHKEVNFLQKPFSPTALAQKVHEVLAATRR
jgi:PAS domain S-box-containing protein